MRVPKRAAVSVGGGLCLAALLAAVFSQRLLRGPAAPPAEAGAGQGAAAPPPPGPPSPAEARAAAIRATMEAIREECRRNAGGDWGRWEEQSRPYRDDLGARVRAAKPYNPTAEGAWFEGRAAVLEGKGDFPLFEAAPDHYLAHLLDPKNLDAFRQDRPVAAGARWLPRRGIDVLFVPVPKMTEVYPEHFADHCPPDRVVAPHMRRLLLDLLEADVEVVDLLPSFLEERDKDPAPLYQSADPHWAP